MRDKIYSLQEQGYCVLEQRYTRILIAACRAAFWPRMLQYIELHHSEPNRGPHHHFIPMPFVQFLSPCEPVMR